MNDVIYQICKILHIWTRDSTYYLYVHTYGLQLVSGLTAFNDVLYKLDVAAVHLHD